MRSNTVRRYGMLVLLGSIVPFALAANADTAAAKQERGGSGIVAGNERIEAAFTRRDNALLAQGIVNLGTKFNWVAPDTAAGPQVLQGESLTTGFGGQGGFQFSKQSQQSTAQGGTESLVQGAGANGLALDWWVRSFPRVSVVEYQARLRNTGAAVIPKLKEFGPLTLRLRGDQGQLKVHWVRRDAYQKQEATLKDSLTVDGGSWNAPESAGWVMIENVDKKEILFLGVEWESYWRVTLRRQGAEVALECMLERFVRDLAPGAEMMSPRVFLGVSHGNVDDAVRDLHDYLRQYVIPPSLPNFPWVTYDIWGTAGDGSDEKAILDEIPFAASLGVELFYVDAGWYEGSCKVKGRGDWFTGLGNWHKEDFEKYPHGLAPIARKVHEAGMKFGLWFAPQIVDAKLIGNRIPESWVAQRDGKNLVADIGSGWAPVAQICMGDPEVVEFLKTSIASAVERYDLDWVKWDNSGLPGFVCTRTGHGHQELDGHIAALAGEYKIWEYLHKKFPNLVLEQCGYPSRLDYGLARYMRTNWLDDSSGEAAGCRQRTIVGTYVYPSPCLETWVYKGAETDQEKDPDILNTTIRSRMIGLFGFGCLVNDIHGVERVSLYPPEAIAAIKRNIADYKKFRHLLQEDVYHFARPAGKAGPDNAIQFCKRDGSESVVIVFQGGHAHADPNAKAFKDAPQPELERTITPRGLKAELSYIVTSLNTGKSEKVAGVALLSEGLKTSFAKPGMSEILLIRSDR